MSFLDRITETYRSEGILTVLDRSVTYLRWRLQYALHGAQTVRVTFNDIEATFEVDSLREFIELMYFSEYERVLVLDLIDELQPGDIVFDIGANIGMYTIVVAKALKEGSVIAFEPHPPNRDRLERNAELNRVGDCVSVCDVALSNETATVSLTDKYGKSADNDAVSGTLSITEQTTDELTVNSVPGDSLVASGRCPQPSVLKIDVEGAEPLVIDGLTQTLQDPTCRVIYCEVHTTEVGNSISNYGSTDEDITRWFGELGFDVSVLQDREEQGLLLKAVK